MKRTEHYATTVRFTTANLTKSAGWSDEPHSNPGSAVKYTRLLGPVMARAVLRGFVAIFLRPAEGRGSGRWRSRPSGSGF
eukprot:7280051-Prymnesium_polylepis.1